MQQIHLGDFTFLTKKVTPKANIHSFQYVVLSTKHYNNSVFVNLLFPVDCHV